MTSVDILVPADQWHLASANTKRSGIINRIKIKHVLTGNCLWQTSNLRRGKSLERHRSPSPTTVGLLIAVPLDILIGCSASQVSNLVLLSRRESNEVTVPGQKFSRKRGNSRHALNFPSKPPTFFNYHTMIRSPLGPISSNRVHKQEYTPYQRGLIHGAISGGLTLSKVQRLHGISESFVRGICNAVV